MRTFIIGLGYPFRALGFLRQRRDLWLLVLAPVAINLVLGGLIYAGLLYAGFQWVDGVVTSLPVWATWLAWLLRIVLAIAMLVLLGYLLVRFGVILGAPFYGQLSERIEQYRTGDAPPASPLSIGGVAHDLWRALTYELKKLLLTLALLLPILLVGLIPVAGQVIALMLQIMLGALITCLDFLDSPLERRRLRFRAKLATIRRGLPLTAGFGLICLGLVSIPGVNLLAIPLCVAAGTLAYCDNLRLTAP